MGFIDDNMIEKNKLEEIVKVIREEFPEGRYPFRAWNKCEISIALQFVLKNYSIEKIKTHITEMKDHNKICRGSLREDSNLIEEKILGYVLNDNLTELLKFAEVQEDYV